MKCRKDGAVRHEIVVCPPAPNPITYTPVGVCGRGVVFGLSAVLLPIGGGRRRDGKDAARRSSVPKSNCRYGSCMKGLAALNLRPGGDNLNCKGACPLSDRDGEIRANGLLDTRGQPLRSGVNPNHRRVRLYRYTCDTFGRISDMTNLRTPMVWESAPAPCWLRNGNTSLLGQTPARGLPRSS